MESTVYLFITLMSECYSWIELSHWSIFTKYKKHLFLKLPSTFGLQPQRVSWRDNKLAPLSGRGDRSSASLGDDIDLLLDDRKEIDTIRLYIFYLATPLTKWLPKELTPGQTQKAHWQHQFLIQKKSSARAKHCTGRPPDLQLRLIQVFQLILIFLYLKSFWLKPLLKFIIPKK